MGRIITSATFATPAAYVGSTPYSTTATPLANIGDYVHPSRVYRSAAYTNGTTYCGVDLGAATTVVAIACLNLNLASVKLQKSTDGASWVDVATVSVVLDTADQQYKFYQTVASVSSRYWRILSNSASTTDSTSAMQCGAFIVMTAVTTWTYNPGFPYQKTPLRAVAEGRFDGGGREPVRLGGRYCQIGLSQPFMPTAGATDIETVLAYNEDQPFLYYRNLSSVAEVYIVHRIGLGTWQQDGGGYWNLGSMLLESVP